MSTHIDLLKARFHLNMRRINGLVKLIFADPLRPTELFQSSGVRADILRTIIVSLHATFEDVLRNRLSKQNKKLSFCSGSDLDKFLALSGIDARPFKPLYPPLIQMAKRRNRIVHNADLSNRTDTVLEIWGVADHWQLIMWLRAVPAFYYQLRATLNPASVVEREIYEKHRKAMLSHVDFGNHLLASSKLLELSVGATQSRALIKQRALLAECPGRSIINIGAGCPTDCSGSSAFRSFSGCHLLPRLSRNWKV